MTYRYVYIYIYICVCVCIYVCIYIYMNTVHCFYRLSVGFTKSAVKANSRNTIPPIMVTVRTEIF